MKDPKTEYAAALADFAQPGGKWENKGRLTYWGRAAGLTAEDIIADARAAGVTDRDGDIRRGWADAPHSERTQGGWHTPRAHKPKAPTFPNYVRDMIAAGGGSATVADLTAMSPSAILPTPQLQTRDFFRACYDGGDMLFIDNSERHQLGEIGANIKTVDAWVDWCCLAGDMGGDILLPNPLTGKPAENAQGYQSYTASACIATFPFIVIEFDAMPIEAQCAFWRGILAKSPIGRKVVSITHSGGKSLHGLVYVGADTVEAWRNSAAGLRRMLCADSDEAYRCDPAALSSPRQGTRLPGVARRGKGAGQMQNLVYLNPTAREAK